MSTESQTPNSKPDMPTIYAIAYSRSQATMEHIQKEDHPLDGTFIGLTHFMGAVRYFCHDGILREMACPQELQRASKEEILGSTESAYYADVADIDKLAKQYGYPFATTASAQ